MLFRSVSSWMAAGGWRSKRDEPKAKLGALPLRTRVWLRHAAAPVNLVVRSLLGAVPHGEAPDRNPFKDAAA